MTRCCLAVAAALLAACAQSPVYDVVITGDALPGGMIAVRRSSPPGVFRRVTHCTLRESDDFDLRTPEGDLNGQGVFARWADTSGPTQVIFDLSVPILIQQASVDRTGLTGPLANTFAHELGHFLGLDHTTGASGSESSCVVNDWGTGSTLMDPSGGSDVLTPNQCRLARCNAEQVLNEFGVATPTADCAGP